MKYESGLQNVYVIISDKRSDYEDIKSTINAGMLKKASMMDLYSTESSQAS